MTRLRLKLIPLITRNKENQSIEMTNEIHIQQGTNILERLLNKLYVNEVTLRVQNLSLKCCQPLGILTYFEKGFRSFLIGIIGSINQWAAKLPRVAQNQ